tara:strand:- start:263 stop:1162 length:900 start_codon:yes stop_codon:yes gene_type:complete
MAFNQNANPLYGQNKADKVFTEKGRLHKSAGVPVQDANGIAPLGGTIMPPRHFHIGESTDDISLASADPYTQGTAKLFPLGTELVWGERAFRYVFMNGAVTAGKLVQQPAVVGNHSQMTATATTAVTTSSTSEISVETQGDDDFTLNEYADGYLYVNDADGEGQSWKVKSHPAHDHSDDASVVVTVYDRITTALATTSELTIVLNPYKDVIVAPASESGAVLGATVIDMSDDNYGWVQFKGPKAMLISNAVVVTGGNVVRSTTDAGAIQAAPSDILYPVGQCMAGVVVDTEYAMVWLNI